MDITKGFYDLCIPFIRNTFKMQQILDELIALDYKTIAIEQIYDHTQKPEKKLSDIFPEPSNIEYLKQKYNKKLTILQRLTIIYDDVAISHAMTNSSNLKKFNIIAGLPKTEVALNHCCTTFNGDIICTDPDDQKLLVNRKTYEVAVKRCIAFEIKYSHIITNSSCRKNMIKIAHNYHVKGKSKNIIFSSGAENIFEIRGPYDVANLALIFGLSEEQGKNAISGQCRKVYLRAESRRFGKTTMFMKNVGPIVMPSSSEDEDDDDASSDNQESMDKNESNKSERAIKNSNDDRVSNVGKTTMFMKNIGPIVMPSSPEDEDDDDDSADDQERMDKNESNKSEREIKNSNDDRVSNSSDLEEQANHPPKKKKLN